MILKVIKRDGSKEIFLIEKIVRVVMAAGLESHQAQTLAAKIEKWAKNQKQTEITTLQVRDEVIKELKKSQPKRLQPFCLVPKNQGSKSSKVK